MNITKLMSTEGPVVKCILIKPSLDNETIIEEIEIDMTPKKDVLSEILGPNKTFLGQFEENDDTTVVAMTSLKKTLHTDELKYRLPPPLNNEKIYDNILLIRMKWNEVESESIPIDLTYESYLNCSFNSSTE